MNGYTLGRIGFNIIREKLDSFFYEMWEKKDWKFRAPKDIKETKLFVKNYMQIINTLFLLRDCPAQYIGGKTQILTIKQPKNIVDSIK